MFEHEEKVDRGMSVDDAMDIVGHLADFLKPERLQDTELREDLITAGEVIAEQVHELSIKLAEAEARAAAFVEDAVTGDRLIRGEDAGGPRHYLAGRPVPAGTLLWLLTADAPRLDARALRVVVQRPAAALLPCSSPRR